MPPFRCRSRDELGRLSSDDLVGYIAEALEAGDGRGVEDGLGVLTFRQEGDLRRRVAIKVPRDSVEDVAQEALYSAIKAILDGRPIDNFEAWLSTVVRRRIADFHRRLESRPREAAYPEEHAEAEEIWGEAGSVDNETATVEARDAIERVRARLNEVHREVVVLYVFEDLSAQEAADEVNQRFEGHPDLPTPMTIDNVHQIAKRFREALRGELEDSED